MSDVNSISTEAHKTERVQSKPDIHVLQGATIFVSHITKSITKFSRMLNCDVNRATYAQICINIDGTEKFVHFSSL